MKDPTENMAAILQHIARAEKELSTALGLFVNFPTKRSKNGARRMDSLFKAKSTIAVVRSHLPQDWKESGWFDDSKHLEFLNSLTQATEHELE
jgi:hypothetical protein